MRFKDLSTGNILETENEMVVEQFRAHKDRYMEMDAEAAVEEPAETEPKRAGRPRKTEA